MASQAPSHAKIWLLGVPVSALGVLLYDGRAHEFVGLQASESLELFARSIADFLDAVLGS